ncbi:heterocyst differentiation master regulator HetR [Picosynechococcus sp. PCC 7117]|uniref:heterocyst differentiation master regulator HetR n=1 Tax=Picosynechococcus sp. PCC 7117 TaxID=195498 RepID=UPI001E658805|nr:heterocyst differentiation master regulator HetR [Picosynechococcus sp. PCC 7117]
MTNSSGAFSSMAQPELELLQALNPSAFDQVLLSLAFFALRQSSYRHGAFLDAAATAAKCAVYTTYVEQGGNLRMTGHLHHIEPKRVKAIVQEIEQGLQAGQRLQHAAFQEPTYLTELPQVWLGQYPWHHSQPRLTGDRLSEDQQTYLEAKLPPDLPAAQGISSAEFADLIAFLHQQAQAKIPGDRPLPLSEALAEHIKRRLLHAETVMRLDNPWGMPYYILLSSTYGGPDSPTKAPHSLLEDAAHFLRLSHAWTKQQHNVMRIFESLDIAPADLSQAQTELHELMRHWAKKYHQRGKPTMAIHMMFGPKDHSLS